MAKKIHRTYALDADVLEAIKRKAAKENRTVANLIETVLKEHLSLPEKPVPRRSDGTPYPAIKLD